MSFLDRLNLPNLDFMQNRSGSRIIKYQKSQALTSHFESFWSIVQHTFSVLPITSPGISDSLALIEILDSRKNND